MPETAIVAATFINQFHVPARVSLRIDTALQRVRWLCSCGVGHGQPVHESTPPAMADRLSWVPLRDGGAVSMRVEGREHLFSHSSGH